MDYKDVSNVEFFYLETSKAIFWDNGEFVYHNNDAVNNILNSPTVIEDNLNKSEELIRIFKKI